MTGGLDLLGNATHTHTKGLESHKYGNIKSVVAKSTSAKSTSGHIKVYYFFMFEKVHNKKCLNVGNMHLSPNDGAS